MSETLDSEALLDRLPLPGGVADLAAAVGEPVREVEAALRRLARRGLVRAVPRGPHHWERVT